MPIISRIIGSADSEKSSMLARKIPRAIAMIDRAVLIPGRSFLFIVITSFLYLNYTLFNLKSQNKIFRKTKNFLKKI